MFRNYVNSLAGCTEALKNGIARIRQVLADRFNYGILIHN
jgi:hypothetical protein